jgi:hypothetical protein
MPIRMSRREAQQLLRTKLPAVKKPQRDDGYDSQLEADYAAHLDTTPDRGLWKAHPWQFILVPGKQPVRYTPDFLLMGKTPWQIHEVKGFWRPKDRVIIKLCAERWPQFRVVGVTREHGQWVLEEFSR